MALSKSGAARPRSRISKEQIYREAQQLVENLADLEIREKACNLPEREAMIHALWWVDSFLHSLGYHGGVLYWLRRDLWGLEKGITAPTLKANKKKAGRKPDSSHIQELKGKLAGIARLQMAQGMSRNDAAAWLRARYQVKSHLDFPQSLSLPQGP